MRLGNKAQLDFQNMVVADARGKLSEELAQALRQPGMLQEWVSTLVLVKQDIEAQMSKRNSEAATFQQECLQAGHAGKNDWFTFAAEHKTWKGGANRFKTLIEQRISEARRLIRETEPDGPVRKSDFMEQLAARVARTEKLVELICAKLEIDTASADSKSPQDS